MASFDDLGFKKRSSSNKDGILSRKYSFSFIIISLVAVILAIVFVITNI
jgi:hypothetical protein